MLIECEADEDMIAHALTEMQNLTECFLIPTPRIGGEKIYVVEEAN